MSTLRQRLGEALFARVAGPEGPVNREKFRSTPGPRWFAPDRPIRRVHGDAAMFVGGLRALLLQSLHPHAMIAVAQHSDYRNDPWGRLQRRPVSIPVHRNRRRRHPPRKVVHGRHSQEATPVGTPWARDLGQTIVRPPVRASQGICRHRASRWVRDRSR